MSPTFSRAWMNRARLRLEAGDRKRALADAKAALEIEPASPRARKLRDLALKKDGSQVSTH
jgi:hypothetical protein